MNQGHLKNLYYLIALAVGTGGAFGQSVIHPKWFGWFYLGLLVLSLVMGATKTVTPWKWGLVLVLSFGFMTMALYGTQVPVLEIPFMILMAIPCIAAAKLGQFGRKRLEYENAKAQ